MLLVLLVDGGTPEFARDFVLSVQKDLRVPAKIFHTALSLRSFDVIRMPPIQPLPISGSVSISSPSPAVASAASESQSAFDFIGSSSSSAPPVVIVAPAPSLSPVSEEQKSPSPSPALSASPSLVAACSVSPAPPRTPLLLAPSVRKRISLNSPFRRFGADAI